MAGQRRALLVALVGVVLLATACGGGDGADTAIAGQPTQSSGAAGSPPTTACPAQAAKVSGPVDWKMTDDFSGHETWTGTATITNPNPTDITVNMYRSFALVTVTRADGSTYEGYTSPMIPVLPASSGYADFALVQAGKAIEMTTSGKFLRPAEVTTAKAFFEVGGAVGGGCTVALDGAVPSVTATRGPKICAGGHNTDIGGPNIDIGLQQSEDRVVCR